MEMGGKKFAVLLCAEDSDYVKKIYGGYFGVFVRMLGEEGETWEVYRVAIGEFPDDDEIESFDGFVITGSCNDAHGNDVWICRLLNLLKKLDSMKKKVLGICFGHQIFWGRGRGRGRRGLWIQTGTLGPGEKCFLKFISLLLTKILARSLGGKVVRAVSGWDIGLRAIHFSSTSTKLLSSQKIPALLSVIECHRDEVRDLPPKAELVAWSDNTGIEMFRYGDHFMGIQGHPEYTKDILLHLIDRLLQRNFIVSSFADKIKAKLDEQEPDREAWKKLCTNFLKGRL